MNKVHTLSSSLIEKQAEIIADLTAALDKQVASRIIDLDQARDARAAIRLLQGFKVIHSPLGRSAELLNVKDCTNIERH